MGYIDFEEAIKAEIRDRLLYGPAGRTFPEPISLVFSTGFPEEDDCEFIEPPSIYQRTADLYPLKRA